MNELQLALVLRRALSFSRRKSSKDDGQPQSGLGMPGTPPLSLLSALQDIRGRCTECGICVKSCAFLSHYGTPKAIAATCDFTLPRFQAIGYECSLCGLCAAVCPEGLDPSRIFMECRRLYVDGGHLDASVYKAILGYEKWGTSALFSWYGIPEGCDTVFFPGCSLSGSRPEATLGIFRDLGKKIPTLGVVLDCCTKPSHDLGRQGYFESVFREMTTYLSGKGIKKVLVACPSCYKIFRQYGFGLSVATVYEYLDTDTFENRQKKRGLQASIHDPCALRDATSTHQAVRSLLHGLGMNITEMAHNGSNTICCGEGGTVGCVKAEVAGEWSAMRKKETGELPMVTYCAGCVAFLNQVAPTIHIVDLLYRPESVTKGRLRGAKAPFTYLNRLLLKRRFKREVAATTSRVRRLSQSIGGHSNPRK